jgi:hypothetical protein
MIHHIVVGEVAARALSAAQNISTELEGNIHILQDDLQSGPLQKPDGQSFSALRSAYWHSISNDPLSLERIADQERILMLSTELNKNPNDRAWIWIAPSATDVCAYYWIVAHLGAHIGRLYILNTSNLPFLDADGRVFYPTRLSELEPKEIVKARRLARPITTSELEIDQDAWSQIVNENAAMRTLEGGKKLRSRADDYFDEKILSCLGSNFQKLPRILNQAQKKADVPASDAYISWRLRQMTEEGFLDTRLESGRSVREAEFRLRPAPAAVSLPDAI